MSDIFIGYLREEMAEAGMLANALEQGGWSVCWDSKFQEGASFAEVVEKALREAKCVIVLWSAKSVQSGFFEDLATFAFNQRMLVPVAIEDVSPPARFAKIAVQRLIEWDGSRDCPEFARLVETISALVPPSATAQAKPVERCDQNSSPTVEAGNVFTDILQDGSIGPEMVVIPEGSFEMGDHWDDGTEKNPLPWGSTPLCFASSTSSLTQRAIRCLRMPAGAGFGDR
ncbi:MAG: toll/interleukin-1 receptor domain-containing protein [Desulfuromonadaceae bacterium]